MELIIRRGNVLDAQAEALVFAVDGSAKGMEGNVGRQFVQRWGDEWDEIVKQLGFPIPLGMAAYAKTESPVPFRFIFAASILDHMNKVEGVRMPAVLRSALHEVCRMSQTLRLNSLACPLLKGGWRMNVADSFRVMVEVADNFIRYQATLELYSLHQAELDLLCSLAPSYGIRVL